MVAYLTDQWREYFAAQFLRENWSIILISMGVSICIAVLILFSKSTTSMTLTENLFKSRQQPIWHEDAEFRASFGDLLDELNSDDTKQVMNRYHQKAPDVTHFCFLVHGFSALSKDLSYIEAVINVLAERHKYVLATKEGGGGDNTIRQTLVVHCPACNEHHTTDGVEKGGERLSAEILATIRSTMVAQRQEEIGDQLGDEELKHVTISLLGNSLGGIYCRYAIASIVEQTDNMVLDGAYKLHFNIFCTTAAPHLGVSRHTYVRIPRAAEIGVAHAMGKTGKDLFRVNDLLKTMATSTKFLHPLRQFRKRIAYANAFGTDFPVPTATAAFLHSKSTYPHYLDHPNRRDNGECVVVDDSGLVIAVFHTPPTPESSDIDDTIVGEDDSQLDDLVVMSHCLDSLGWKKVFVDLRNEIPIGLNIPRLPRSKYTSPKKDESVSLQNLKEREVIGSGEVNQATASPPDHNRISFPLGHNMMVAFSRDNKTASFNKGGRPVVNALASELVEFIFSWEHPDQEKSTI